MAEHICPVWVGYFLASPVRKIFQNPVKLLAPYLCRGKKVVDIGPGMGFFSLPMAEMVKPNGKVYCVDLQKEMLEKLEKRAGKKGLSEYIETINCDSESLKLEPLSEQIDFALMFAVLHEVPDQEKFMSQVFNAIKPNGRALLSEPKGHVSETDFEKSLHIAEKVGFKLETCPDIARSHSVIMLKR